MRERVGLYGGSFNPIHCGHLIVGRAVAERLDLHRLIWLCAGQPPHKQEFELVEARHRAEMVRLGIQGEPGFEFDDFDLNRGGPTYTVETVAHYRDQLGPDAVLFWILGADSLAELTTWREVPTIMDTCRVVTLARASSVPVDWSALEVAFGAQRVQALRDGVVETPVMDISATDIRRRVYEGRSIRYLVPESVNQYIERNQLYRAPPSSRMGTRPHA